MRSLRRIRPRRDVALALILGLLGMGWLDVEVCQGQDGHLGLNTRIGSCCDVLAQSVEEPGCCGADAATAECACPAPARCPGPHFDQAAGAADCCDAPLFSAESGAACVDMPWIHGATTVSAAGAPSPAAYGLLFFPDPGPDLAGRLALRAPTPSGAILSRLRTTYLLI